MPIPVSTTETFAVLSFTLVVIVIDPVGSVNLIAFSKRLDTEGEGLISMVAIEVVDIESEIERFRKLGYVLPGATIGPLPDSIVTTISAEQCYGLAIQLIEFSH